MERTRNTRPSAEFKASEKQQNRTVVPNWCAELGLLQNGVTAHHLNSLILL
jgi:hypothetical protein